MGPLYLNNTIVARELSDDSAFNFPVKYMYTVVQSSGKKVDVQTLLRTLLMCKRY